MTMAEVCHREQLQFLEQLQPFTCLICKQKWDTFDDYQAHRRRHKTGHWQRQIRCSFSEISGTKATGKELKTYGNACDIDLCATNEGIQCARRKYNVTTSNKNHLGFEHELPSGGNQTTPCSNINGIEILDATTGSVAREEDITSASVSCRKGTRNTNPTGGRKGNRNTNPASGRKGTRNTNPASGRKGNRNTANVGDKNKKRNISKDNARKGKCNTGIDGGKTINRKTCSVDGRKGYNSTVSGGRKRKTRKPCGSKDVTRKIYEHYHQDLVCSYCGRVMFEFHYPDHKARHKNKPNPFQCLYCTLQFKNSKELTFHCATVHPQVKLFKKSPMAVKKSPMVNRKIQVEDKSSQIVGSKNRAKDKSGQVENKRSTIEGKRRQKKHNVCQKSDGSGVTKYECRVCRKKLQTAKKLDTHFKSHAKFMCQICGKQCRDGTDLKRHNNRNHNKTTESKSSSDIRNKKHPKSRGIGKKIVEDRSSLFKCTKCASVFGCQSELVKHSMVHSNVKPYQCRFCTQRYKRVGDRNRHERYHRGVQLKKCRFCGRGCRDKHALNKHERAHEGEGQKGGFICECCQKQFGTKRGLAKHMVMHKKKKGV